MGNRKSRHWRDMCAKHKRPEFAILHCMQRKEIFNLETGYCPQSEFSMPSTSFPSISIDRINHTKEYAHESAPFTEINREDFLGKKGALGMLLGALGMFQTFCVQNNTDCTFSSQLTSGLITSLRKPGNIVNSGCNIKHMFVTIYRTN